MFISLLPKSNVAVATQYNPVAIVRNGTGIVHEIGKSHSSSGIVYPQVDANGLIHGMPADAYFMWAPSGADIEKYAKNE